MGRVKVEDQEIPRAEGGQRKGGVAGLGLGWDQTEHSTPARRLAPGRTACALGPAGRGSVTWLQETEGTFSLPTGGWRWAGSRLTNQPEAGGGAEAPFPAAPSGRGPGWGRWRFQGWGGHGRSRHATSASGASPPPSPRAPLPRRTRAGSVPTLGPSVPTRYSTPSMKLVSRCWMSTRRKDISLRVFSKMTRGSSERQRRQLGAITMARLLTSILVMATLAGCTNTCGGSGGWARAGSGGGGKQRRGGGVPTAYLEEADEVAQHQAVDAGQRVHHGHSGLRALVVRDALLVELVRDQGLLQLPVPQLQQRRWERIAGCSAEWGRWGPAAARGEPGRGGR